VIDLVFKTVADQLATKQKEISISEFFEKNKHILGFDNPTRAMLVTVKEGVDNALDACEEADVLPDIYVEVRQDNGNGDEYTVIVEDNGPGIVKRQIPKIFGKLLYGSRFHAIRQSRGQQGIGISAAVMYGQITTGQPTRIMSKISNDEPAYNVKLIMDTKKNRPNTQKMEVILWDEKEHGTRVEITILGRYKRGKSSVFEYIKETSIVNPHARITFKEPDGTVTYFERVTEKLPIECVEIKPHPQGIELGTFLNMAKMTQAYRFTSFMVNEFSRVSYRTAREIAKEAEIAENMKPSRITLEQAKAILDAVKRVKIMAPPTDCLSPIGDMLIRKGLRKEIDSKFAYTVTREPAVFSGTPFQVEAGLVYGGELPPQDQVKIMRFANRVPLMFQQGGCVITKAVEDMKWRQYGFEQAGGSGIPRGPAIILVHVASTNVPFTSEAKEAITDIPEMKNEIQNALRELARRLKTHIRKKAKLKKVKEKYELIQKVLPEIANKVSGVLDKPVPDITPVVTQIMNIVYLDSNIEYVNENGEGKTHAEIYVTNYTPKNKSMILLCRIPEAMVHSVSPQPMKIEDGFIHWSLKDLEPNHKVTISFDLLGLDKGDFEECELFYSKARGEIVGADQA
jgi:DNA topoisomerase-6 subunit B